jgi:aryl-alcohol dehydrogenase-like predicted oxidoreductase
MELRSLGRSGLRVSLVGLGCANFGSRMDEAAVRAVVDRAIDCGITFFDTADSYGSRGASEEMLGAALGARRRDVAIATKFGNTLKGIGPQDRRPGASARYVMSAVEASLRRLGTDWIDLYQIHYPDPDTPIEETLRALEDLKQQGKIRFAGNANFSAQQIDDAEQCAAVAGIAPFVSCQNQYSLVARDLRGEGLAAVERNKLALIPFAPLANGLLSGKYRLGQPLPPGARLTVAADRAARYLSPTNLEMVEALQAFSEVHGHSLLELAFSWLAGHRSVSTIIAGAMTPQQVERNAVAAGWQLSAQQMAEINHLLGPHRPRNA